MIKEVKHPTVYCSNCGHEWWYDDEDIQEETAYYYSNEGYIINFIVCPNCGEHLQVYTKLNLS